jgi:glycosyltransferase involved in cell wall biosynthesis
MSADAKPRVSIALSMRDAAATIGAALRSLLAQTMADWELILIDDGSSDASVEVARSFADHRIQIQVDGTRLGLAARLNQAIDIAQARYLARMDADDIAYPERLEQQLAYLDAHPQVDLLGAAMMVFEGDGQPVGLFPSRAEHAQICARPFSGFYLAHPTWLGKLEWFKRWRYDPAWRKAQDQDLLLRAWSASRFAALPQPLVGYRQDAVSLRKSIVGRYYFSRAILRVARRDGQVTPGVLAVAEQIAKLGFEFVAITTGQPRSLLRHRALPFSEAQAKAWRQAWAASHPEKVVAPQA